jgi:type II secretory pathway pseudopilin PulG
MVTSREPRAESRKPGNRPKAGVHCPRHSLLGLRRHLRAFTLLEVMIAGGILFMCLFVILALISSSLRNARLLQQQKVDAGMAAAQLSVQFANTNQLSEGSGSGDFGKWYPDFRYDWELKQIGTNGLCALDIVVRRHGSGPAAESQMTTLLYLPKLQQNGILKGP